MTNVPRRPSICKPSIGKKANWRLIIRAVLLPMRLLLPLLLLLQLPLLPVLGGTGAAATATTEPWMHQVLSQFEDSAFLHSSAASSTGGAAAGGAGAGAGAGAGDGETVPASATDAGKMTYEFETQCVPRDRALVDRMLAQQSGKGYLVVHAQHGLGNRLRAMCSGVSYAAEIGLQPVVLWERDIHIQAAFGELFHQEGLPWEFLETNCAPLLREPEFVRVSYIANNAKNKKMLITAPSGRKSLYVETSEELVTKPSVSSNKIRQCWSQLWPRLDPSKAVQAMGGEFIGLHIRNIVPFGADVPGILVEKNKHTDVAAMGGGREHRASCKSQYFVAAATAHLMQNPRTRFYITADNKEAVEYVRDGLGHLQSFTPPEEWLDRCIPNTMISRDPECIKIALNDMVILSRSNSFFFGSVWSSFSEAVKKLAPGKLDSVVPCNLQHDPIRDADGRLPFYRRVLVHSKKRAAICAASGAGDSVLLSLFNHMNRRDFPSRSSNELVRKRVFTPLAKFSKREIPDLVRSTLYKFGVIREPRSRLVSAFRHNIVEADPEARRQTVGQLAVATGFAASQEVQKAAAALTHDLQFPALVTLLSMALTHNRFGVAPIWAPQADLCGMQVMDYDTLVDFADLHDAAKLGTLFSKIGLSAHTSKLHGGTGSLMPTHNPLDQQSGPHPSILSASRDIWRAVEDMYSMDYAVYRTRARGSGGGSTSADGHVKQSGAHKLKKKKKQAA